MKTLIKIACLFIVINTQVLIGQTANQTFTVQGVLRDASGKTLADGNYGFRFEIWDDENGTGSRLWDEDATINVVNGVWSYSLGENANDPLDNLADINYLLVQVSVDGGTYEKMLNPDNKLTKINLTPYELMVVTGQDNVFPSSGSVGIGTSSPSFKLDMRGDDKNARLGQAEIGGWPAASDYAYFGNQNLDHAIVGNYALLQYSSGTTYLNAADGQKLYFRINNVSKMTLKSNGNFGIGNIHPSERLDVVGNIKLNGELKMAPGLSGPKIADTFAGNTNKSKINFEKATGSNDPGAIIHETRGSGGSAETNEGVLHLMPSDDNSYGDYVSIHGTNDPDKIKLHTSGKIEGVTDMDMSGYVKGGSGSVVKKVYINSTPGSGSIVIQQIIPEVGPSIWTAHYSHTYQKIFSDSHVIIEASLNYELLGHGTDYWQARIKAGNQYSFNYLHISRAFLGAGKRSGGFGAMFHINTENTSSLSIETQFNKNSGDDQLHTYGMIYIITEIRP